MKHGIKGACVAGCAALIMAAIHPAAADVNLAEIRRTVGAAAAFDEGGDRALLDAVEKLAARAGTDTALREPLEEELARALAGEATTAARRFFGRQLWMLGTGTSVPVLAQMLTGGDPHDAEIACYALNRHPAPSVGAALREALPRMRGRALLAAIALLGDRRDAGAVAALGTLAGVSDDATAEAAIEALGKIAVDPAVDILAGLANGPRRVAAAHALLQAAATRAAEGRASDAAALYEFLGGADLPVHVRRGALLGRIACGGPGAAALVLAALEKGDPDLCAAAIAAIPRAMGDDAIRLFADRLAAQSAPSQVLLIAALAERGDPAARPAVTRAAGHDDPSVRVAAVTALGRLGDASSVGPLVAALGSEVPDESAAAGASLRRLNADGVDAAILAGMKKTGGASRVGLIGILADRHCTEAVDALLDELAADDVDVRRAACKALPALAGPEAIPPLVDWLLAHPGDPAAGTAETALAHMAAGSGDPAAATAVVQAAASAAAPAGRAAMIRVLGRLGGPRACAAVTSAVDDPQPAVREAALRALASWPDNGAADVLWELARKAGEPAHRTQALRGYLRLLGDDEAMPAGEKVRRYAEALALTADPGSRKMVLSGLARVARPEALALAMVQYDDPAVRAEAALAAVAIARANPGAGRDGIRAAMTRIAGPGNREDVAARAREVMALLDGMGDAITDWRVAGPYGVDGKRYDALFDVVFEPEKPQPEGVVWRALPAGTDPERPWLMDLLKALGGEQRAAYALTWLHADAKQPARLELGSDDGVKAWLNGRLVHARNVARAAEAYTDRADIVLEAGWNPLLLKITQNNLPWEFCARIVRPDGTQWEGVRIDAGREGNWMMGPGSGAESPTTGPAIRLFDGRTFEGWEGNREWFRIEDGAIVGGHLDRAIPRNEFLCTTKEYGDFELRVQVRLEGNRGNAGIQVRSRRIPDHHEMIGYQADVGPGVWGGLYDESRRRQFLAKPDAGALAGALKPDDWNRYVIRCEGRRIRLWLNGGLMADYTETDEEIPLRGQIGLQIHAGPASEVRYRDIEVIDYAAR